MGEQESASTIGKVTNSQGETLKPRAIAVGSITTGGWVAYDFAGAAFDDIGFGMSFPDEAYGRGLAGLWVINHDFRRYLSIEYRDESHVTSPAHYMDSHPIAIVQKSREGMPPGIKTDTAQNRHNIEMSGHAVTVCGNESVTTARWKITDPDTGITWHYYASIGKSLSDRELLGFIRQFDEDFVWNRPKSVM